MIVLLKYISLIFYNCFLVDPEDPQIDPIDGEAEFTANNYMIIRLRPNVDPNRVALNFTLNTLRRYQKIKDKFTNGQYIGIFDIRVSFF